MLGYFLYRQLPPDWELIVIFWTRSQTYSCDLTIREQSSCINRSSVVIYQLHINVWIPLDKPLFVVSWSSQWMITPPSYYFVILIPWLYWFSFRWVYTNHPPSTSDSDKKEILHSAMHMFLFSHKRYSLAMPQTHTSSAWYHD